MKPRVFIGSSVEQLELAYAIQDNLQHDIESTVWDQGVFELSRTAMASLIDQLDDSDFGIFVLAPDDVTTIRKTDKSTVRDNVVFELGLFIGRLGSERCFLVVPANVEDLHLPTDLLGITPANFSPDRQDGNMQAALGSACNRLRKAINRLGRLDQSPKAAASASTVITGQEDSEELCNDPVDCEAFIRSWMGARPSSMNMSAIRYAEVDRELKLEPGSARKYIEKAASHFRYEADLQGKESITFKKMKNVSTASRISRHSDWLNR
ncbi:TIR domain-containing protein [Tardiphaga sp. 20_F10_N6_6]|uniref:TIR domain-containing protein n=1 Tax=Tardiphaga sp. 20_F10_N6_6 TaxID=3240788 RepID=UPI003F89E54E